MSWERLQEGWLVDAWGAFPELAEGANQQLPCHGRHAAVSGARAAALGPEAGASRLVASRLDTAHGSICRWPERPRKALPVTVSIPWPPGATCSAVLLRHWGSFLVVGLLLRLRHWHMRTALGPCGLSFAVSCYVSGSSSGSDSEDGS